MLLDSQEQKINLRVRIGGEGGGEAEEVRQMRHRMIPIHLLYHLMLLDTLEQKLNLGVTCRKMKKMEVEKQMIQ